MRQDLFTHLPPEIITNILARLPVRSISICKCVCKWWLDLLEADDFVNFHLTVSAPALAILTDSNRFQVFELEDELDLVINRRHDPLIKFDFPHEAIIEGSANGLLFLHNDEAADDLYVCNPITRQICELPSPPQGIAFGFGAGKISGQHKVVCIDSVSQFSSNSDCHVYTLGSGSWRRIEASLFRYAYGSPGALVDGNLHWIVAPEPVSNDDRFISCFDVETECFSTFPPPIEKCSISLSLFTLRDCLCFCDESSANEIVIWLVKEYRVAKCWSKEYVIPQHPDHGVHGSFEYLHPIKVFQNGDILMLWDEQYFCYYSTKTKTHQEIGFFGGARDDDNDDGDDDDDDDDEEEDGGYYDYISLMLFTPSFLSLKTLGMDNVISF